jgi:hypothetical protein
MCRSLSSFVSRTSSTPNIFSLLVGFVFIQNLCQQREIFEGKHSALSKRSDTRSLRE